MMKKITAAVLAMLLALTACSKEPAARTEQPAEETALLTSPYVYTASYTDLRSGGLLINDVTAGCRSGENLYFIAYRGTGKRLWEDGSKLPGENSLLRWDGQTGKPVLLADHTDQLPEGALDVLAMTPGEDGTVWVWQQLFSCDKTVYGPELCQYDADGNLLQRIPVQGLSPVYLTALLRDDGGNFAVSDGEALYLLDGQGQLLHTMKPDGPMTLARYEGSCGCLLQTQDGQTVFRPLELRTGEFGPEQPLPEGAASVTDGTGDYSCVYDRGGDAVYGLRAEDAAAERLLTWSDHGILRENVRWYGVGEAGEIRCLLSGAEGCELVVLKRTDPSLLPEQTVLTMGCLNGMAESIRSDVIAFNKKHPSVKISLVDYEEFGSVSGETLLHTQLLAGEGPDLFYMDSMDLMMLADTGAMLDLWPLIDGDPELSRDSLMTHVFEVMARDERLYGVSSSFLIETNAVLPEHLPDQYGWTLAELQQARALAGDCPYVFGPGDTRQGLLFRLVGHNAGDFLDWQTGTCRFDTPEFAALLEFVKAFPDEADSLSQSEEDDRLLSREQLCAGLYIDDFSTFRYALETFGSEVRFVGYPSETGQNYFRLTGCFAIAAGCANPEAAWEFGRMLLTESYQREQRWMWGFPTNRAVFEQQLEQAMTRGDTVWDKYWLTDGDSHRTAPLSQADRDRFLALYRSCNRTFGYDDAVMTVVSEEAEYYFNGIKSAEETAEIIQNRVALYMAERGSP